MKRLGWAGLLVVGLTCLIAWLGSRDTAADEPPAAVSIDSGTSATRPTEEQGSRGIRPAEAEPSDVINHAPDAEGAVRTVPSSEPSLEQQAKAFLAQPAGSDIGIQTIRKSLQSALGSPPELDPFAEPMPSLGELRESKHYNPASIELGGEDLRAMQALIAEFGAKLRSAKRDIYLADQLALAQAIQSGDFVTKPNGSDPDGVASRLRAEAQKRNPEGKWLSGELPGSDFSHNRFVLLEQSKCPSFVAAQHALNAQRAEFAAALRSVYAAAARSRR